jgi:hypothetical protein
VVSGIAVIASWAVGVAALIEVAAVVEAVVV